MNDFVYQKIQNSAHPLKLVVFLHGYISYAADVLPFMHLLEEQVHDALIVVPESEMACEISQFKKQWFGLKDIDPTRQRHNPDLSVCDIINIYNKMGVHISKVASRVNRFISQMQREYGISNKNTFLMGFSQGAMLALYTGLTRRYQLGGIFSFAGVICGKDSLEKELKAKPNVYLFHGTKDGLVQYKTCAFTQKWLEDHHIVQKTFKYKDLEHKLTPEEMADAALIINQSS